MSRSLVGLCVKALGFDTKEKVAGQQPERGTFCPHKKPATLLGPHPQAPSPGNTSPALQESRTPWDQGPANPTHSSETQLLTRKLLAMRSPGTKGPTEFSTSGRRYSSGWVHSHRLKLRAKARGYCSPRPRETGH